MLMDPAKSPDTISMPPSYNLPNQPTNLITTATPPAGYNFQPQGPQHQPGQQVFGQTSPTAGNAPMPYSTNVLPSLQPQMTGTHMNTGAPIQPQMTGNTQMGQPQMAQAPMGQPMGASPTYPMNSFNSHASMNPQGAPPQMLNQQSFGAQSQFQQQQQFAQQPQQQQYHTAVSLHALSSGSAPVDCPVCRKRGMTMTNTEVGRTTHLWALGFCLFLGLGCIPYLMSSTMDVRHNCGHCGALLATWQRSGRTVVHAFA